MTQADSTARSTSRVSLAEHLAQTGRSAVKLHLGCGGVRWKDFINVDLYPDDGLPDDSRDGCIADVFADIRALDLPENTIDEIFTSHVIEHFPRWVALKMLEDWFRMLKPGGQVVIEMPDFWRCVLWLFHPLPKNRRVARSQFYGNQWDQRDYETHRYVWAGSEFKKALLAIGFSTVKVSHWTETHYKGRDMRVTATK